MALRQSLLFIRAFTTYVNRKTSTSPLVNKKFVDGRFEAHYVGGATLTSLEKEPKSCILFSTRCTISVFLEKLKRSYVDRFPSS